MSSTTADSVQEMVEGGKLKIGNEVKESTQLPTSASKPLYVDSSSKLAGGAFPFPVEVSNLSTTGTVFAKFSGSSTLSENSLYTQIVAASGATTFTTTGYLRVTITDAAGNVTDGDHYIRIGSLT